MYCKRVSVRNFRNIEQAEVCFSPGVNVLIGENAQGKTNLLEAIFYASVGKSFRANHPADLIRFDTDFADISLDYCDQSRDQNIRMRLFRDRQRQVEKNRVRVDKLSDIVGSFRAVLFCPEHLSLIKEGPALRRNYMDVAISRMYPLYMHSLQRYLHILKQRNALIRDAWKNREIFDSTVELWSMQLAQEAAVIAKYRSEFLLRVEKHVINSFLEMTEEHEVPELIYQGSSKQTAEEYSDLKKTEEAYFSLLCGAHDREIAAGATLWGIHKDDVEIRLNGKNARIFASQGQQRSLALALKLAEGEICLEEFGDYPVFLFDDVLSELDVHRRDYLVRQMRGRQVIMTACDPSAADFGGAVNLIRVDGGRYTQREV